MGAWAFEDIIIGRYENVEEAYDDAVQDALHEYGHNDYNGTISTTRGVKLAYDAPRFGTKAYSKWRRDKLETLEKWGHCLAVEVKGSQLKKFKESNGYKGRKGIKAYIFFGWAAT